MKKEKLLKIALVLIMGVILVMMATNVFALDDDYQMDLTNTENKNTSTNTNSNTNTNTNTNLIGNTSKNTSTNTNYNTNVPKNNTNTNLPSTGIAENTMLFVALTVLIIMAIYAYTKFKYYKSI